MKSERSRLPSQEQMGSRIDSGTEYRVPEVHFTEQPLLTDDLMSFSRHVSEEDMLGEIFSKPVMERAEMTPIAEMTPNQLSPVQSMPSPGRDETPVDSPNWRIVNPSEFNTPRTPLTRVRYDVAYGRPPKMNELSPESAVRDDRRSPAISSNAPSPSLEVAAEVAIRQHRVSVGSSIVTKDEDRDEHYDEGPGIIPMSTPHPPFEIPEPGTFGRRAGSPLPEPSLPERDSSTEPEEELRPITPPPLRFGKKARGDPFSISEDDPDKTPLPRRPNSSPQRSPVLTLTKPNSRNEIRITPKRKKNHLPRRQSLTPQFGPRPLPLVLLRARPRGPTVCLFRLRRRTGGPEIHSMLISKSGTSSMKHHQARSVEVTPLRTRKLDGCNA